MQWSWFSRGFVHSCGLRLWRENPRRRRRAPAARRVEKFAFNRLLGLLADRKDGLCSPFGQEASRPSVPGACFALAALDKPPLLRVERAAPGLADVSQPLGELGEAV